MRVAILLVVAVLSAIGFAVNFALGAQTQIAALTLGLAFAAIAAALVVWEHDLMPHEDDVQAMPPQRSTQTDRASAERALADGLHAVGGRRTWLVWLLGATGAVVAGALLVPLRSLSTNLGSSLAHTSWKAGARLVRSDGTLVRAGDVEVDSVLTVFPEGHVGAANSDDMANTATMLVRVPAGELRLPPERATWAPNGLIAYSKVCTHAGCPVALYRARARQLFCPCHQSTFDVLRGGVPVFGPAARALPQLPLRIAADGSLEAGGDFPEPIGPSYWDRA